MTSVVTLVTDFGTRDIYVAAMKGVILTIAPAVTIVDLSHEVPPQDVQEAAWLLRASYGYYPSGTVHVAVVDPGVGTARRAIAVSAGGMKFVAPDNGVLSWALDAAGDAHAIEITNAAYMRPDVSPTFHGRDIFAPAAAHLAAGIAIDALGPPITDVVRLAWPVPRIFDDRIECDVVHVDRFGNLITSLTRAIFDGWRGGSTVSMEAGGVRIARVVRTYADTPAGAIAALFESSGHLELAAREFSASSVLGLSRGAQVIVRRV
jgi:hypothetical protein